MLAPKAIVPTSKAQEPPGQQCWVDSASSCPSFIVSDVKSSWTLEM